SAPAFIRGLEAIAVTVGRIVARARIPFIECDREASDRKGTGDRHLMLWVLVLIVLRLPCRRTHSEAAGRNHDHLGAVTALLEDHAWLERTLEFRGERRERAGRRCGFDALCRRADHVERARNTEAPGWVTEAGVASRSRRGAKDPCRAVPSPATHHAAHA